MDRQPEVEEEEENVTRGVGFCEPEARSSGKE